MNLKNNSAMTSGFMVLHGNRLEDLRDLLVGFMQWHPLPPLVPEVILVQSNGMKHWLELALANDAALGICAATQMELPGGYLWQIYRTVLGADKVPSQMPFDKSNLVWRLMRLLPDVVASNVVYAPLARYLGGCSDGRRLYQLAMQVADVLDGYQSYRADWLVDWAAGQPGHDVLRLHDGSAKALAPEHAWQAQLWRDIRWDVGGAMAETSRSNTHAQFMAAMQAHLAHGKSIAGLPPRVVVFGISSLPMQTVEALAALGEVCQVLMLVQNPCQYYWGDIVPGHDLLRAQVFRRQKAKLVHSMPMTANMYTASHPLLASWGKQGRDYLHLLDHFDQMESCQQQMQVQRVDVFVDPVEGLPNPSLLNHLQSGILNLQGAPDRPHALQQDDSITFVTTHSAQRELEVLHDRLLAWFDADPSLRARDVMVMVPDMATFAPHIQAVFGRFSQGDARYIPYALADTTPRQLPLVLALEQLLSLPDKRVSLANWLGLFEVSAVRERFGVTAADVAQLQSWLVLSGVRWGMDATHRRAWGVQDSVTGQDQNTWAFGLRRLLLGYAVGNGAPWGGTLPQAALNGLDASLISALLQWIDAIGLSLQELSGDHTPSQWGRIGSELMARFFKASDETEDRLIQRCQAPLEAWLQACETAHLNVPLPLNVVRDHWLSQIEAPGLQQRFFGGGVQFGTLMPMRSIPFGVICLLGMNDGDYPRQKASRDFDLMAQSWRAGDRSRREDDRYLFLEALLSARQKLYISWQGHRITDNTEQPPSVLVAQLIDYLNLCWSPAIVPQQQPLQPFSEAYFLHDSPFETYALDWAQVHKTSPIASVEQGQGKASPPCSFTLSELRQLLRQPVEVFFKARLQVWLEGVDELTPEDEPFTLNHLEQYHVGQSLLQAPDLTDAVSRLSLSGLLPLAAFGKRWSAQLQDKAKIVLDRQATWVQLYPHLLPAQSITQNIDGMTLTGVLSGLRCQQPAELETTSHGQWLRINQRVGAVLQGNQDATTARLHIVVGLWVEHLAACASGWPLTSVQLGLDGEVVFCTVSQQEATDILQRLLKVYLAAWDRPLPVACKTAWAWMQAVACSEQLAVTAPDKPRPDPHDAARTAFESGFHRSGERDESAYLGRAFESYDALMAELPDWAQQLYGDLARHVKTSMPSSCADEPNMMTA